jgi:hypothetical protein
LIAERQERAVIETFDSTFAASHDRTNLSIRHILNEFQDQKILSFGRQPSDEAEERILFL